LNEKDDVRLQLCGLPVKQAGLALPIPTKSAPSNYEASTCVNTDLIAALKGIEVFSALTHLATIKEARTELTGRKKATDELVLKAVISALPPDLRRAVTRSKKTGSWLSLMPSTDNGTDLRLQSGETLLVSATGELQETSRHIVTVVARSSVFNMLLKASQAVMRSHVIMSSEIMWSIWPPKLSSHLRFATNL
jgi:hypothetical protein